MKTLTLEEKTRQLNESPALRQLIEQIVTKHDGVAPTSIEQYADRLKMKKHDDGMFSASMHIEEDGFFVNLIQLPTS